MKYLRLFSVLTVSALLLTACSREHKDKAIKAHIASQAKEEIAFAGVTYTVDKGIVQLSGSCPSLKEKEKVNRAVQKIAGVKEVKDSIQIAPVTLGENFWLKQAVDSVLKEYPHVSGQLEQNNLKLYGSTSEKELSELMKTLKQIPVSGIQHQLSFY